MAIGATKDARARACLDLVVLPALQESVLDRVQMPPEARAPDRPARSGERRRVPYSGAGKLVRLARVAEDPLLAGVVERHGRIQPGERGLQPAERGL